MHHPLLAEFSFQYLDEDHYFGILYAYLCQASFW
jgi:hypothetical protein